MFRFRIDEQNRLLAAVRAVLEPQLASHALHCLISGNVLRVYTDSAVWSSQLRFQRDALLQCLQQLGIRHVDQVQIRIGQILPQRPDSTRTPKLPSAENIELLRQQSRLHNGDELDQAFAKLSRTLERRKRA